MFSNDFVYVTSPYPLFFQRLVLPMACDASREAREGRGDLLFPLRSAAIRYSALQAFGFGRFFSGWCFHLYTLTVFPFFLGKTIHLLIFLGRVSSHELVLISRFSKSRAALVCLRLMVFLLGERPTLLGLVQTLQSDPLLTLKHNKKYAEIMVKIPYIEPRYTKGHLPKGDLDVLSFDDFA